MRRECCHTGRCPDGAWGCLCVADDEGSLAETVVAVLVLAIASAMLITFAMASMRSERRLRLKNDAMHVMEVHSVVARRIDCVQYAGTSALSDTEACGPAPSSGIHTVDAGTGSGQSGHDLVSVEWQDYYHLDNCQSQSDTDYPRAVRKITVRWRDGTGGDDVRDITRLVLGPVVPRSRGWVYLSKTTGSAARSQWNYKLTNAATPEWSTVWSTTYEYDRVSGTPPSVTITTEYCRVLVGRPGLLKLGSTLTECKLKQGNNGDPTSTCDNPSGF